MNPNFTFLPQWLEVATQAAQEAGEVLKKYLGNLKKVREKHFLGDLVTEADYESEALLLKILHKNFPDHKILAEESGFSKQDSPFVWAIDPLDGTTNYTHQYPVFAVSIGLLYYQEPILGVIYSPETEELFQAAKGFGATLNDQPIAVSEVASLRDSLLATGFAYDHREKEDNNYAEFCHLTYLSQGVRRAGAASMNLSYVACGRLDGFWEKGLKPWDMAAGIILVREAGGWASNYELGPLDFETGCLLVTNASLSPLISQELKNLKNHLLSESAHFNSKLENYSQTKSSHS